MFKEGIRWNFSLVLMNFRKIFFYYSSNLLGLFFLQKCLRIDEFADRSEVPFEEPELTTFDLKKDRQINILMEKQANPRFDSFIQHFWTEDRKESFEYAVFLTSSSKKTIDTIDDSIFIWLYQLWTPDSFLILSHDRMIILCPAGSIKTLYDLNRMANLEYKPYDQQSDLIQNIENLIGTSAVAVTSNLEQESNQEVAGNLKMTNQQESLEEILIVHEKAEQTRSRNAVKIADRALRKVFEVNMASFLEDHERIECREFSEMVANDINNKDKIGLSFAPTDVQPAFSPAVSCGQSISFAFPPKTSGHIPQSIFNIAISGTIGVNYKSYSGFVGRTYIINATDEQKQAYKAVIKARDAAIESIKIGTPYSAVYDTFKNNLDAKYHPYMPKCIGRFTGVQLCTEFHGIYEDSTDIVKPNTMLVLIFGLEGFPTESSDPAMNNMFNFQVTDTLQIGETEEDGAKLLSSSSAKFKDIAYKLDVTDTKKLKEELLNDTTNMAERTRHHNKPTKPQLDEDTREILSEFKERRNTERAAREEEKELPETKDVSYENEKDVHKIEGHTNKISVASKENKTIFLPIFGLMVPFHISIIKSATDENPENNVSYFTIKFEVPKPDVQSSSLYIKEIQFTAQGRKKFSGIAKQIRDIKTAWSTEQKKRKSDKELYRSTEKLERLENNVPTIKGSNLHIRPVLQGKKSVGVLEAHKNGFRFRSVLGENIVIMYHNIRLSILQESKRETIALIHFYLEKPIKINNKPTTNITFYKQVVESAVDTSMRSSMSEQSELAEDERESKLRKKINNEFKEFCRAVMELHETHPNIPKFEMPVRKLSFYGVPEKSRVLLMPTLSALISVTEAPPFVLIMEDIQLAIFEHIDINMRTFDLTFIHHNWENSDYQSSITQITTIDTEYYSKIKDWLQALNIRFYKQKSNIDWKKALPTLRKNADDFRTFEGWDNFLAESESEDEDNDNTDDQAFDPDDEEYGDDDDDDDDEFDEDAPDTDEDEGEPEEPTSDEEDDWDANERKAQLYDSRHAKRFEDDEDEPRKKKSSSSSKDGHHHHHHHSKH